MVEDAPGLCSLLSKFVSVRLDYGDIGRGATSLAFSSAQPVFVKLFSSLKQKKNFKDSMNCRLQQLSCHISFSLAVLL